MYAPCIIQVQEEQLGPPQKLGLRVSVLLSSSRFWRSAPERLRLIF